LQVVLHFHGDLRRFCPDGFICMASTAADAIKLFFRQHKKAVRNPDGSKRVIQVAGLLVADAYHEPLTKDRLDVCPAFCGAGGKGMSIGQIILGTVLVAVAVFVPGLGTALSTALMSLGISMALGGVLGLLSPAPSLGRETTTNEQTPEESRYLGAAKNTVASGTRIPICYGRFKRYGHILSFDVEADPEPVLGQPPKADQRRRVGSVT
jgi:predicted phage tail protein